MLSLLLHVQPGNYAPRVQVPVMPLESLDVILLLIHH